MPVTAMGILLVIIITMVIILVVQLLLLLLLLSLSLPSLSLMVFRSFLSLSLFAVLLVMAATGPVSENRWSAPRG